MAFEEFRNLPLGEILSLQAQRYPNRTYLKMGDEQWTYAEIEDMSKRLASGIRKLGLRTGDRLAVTLPNIPAFIVSLFAAAKSGVLLVPINVRRSEEEQTARLIKTQPKALISFSDPDHYDDIDHFSIGLQLKSKISHLDHLILYGKDHKDAIQWDQLLETSPENHNGVIDPKDPVAIIHTLGSMGEPRGAMLTHRGIARNAISIVRMMQVTPFDVFLGAVPFSNSFGITAHVLACTIAGTQMICMPRFHPGEALSLILKENITIHHGVPTMFAMELNYPEFNPRNCASLRTGIMSGAPCQPELVSRVRDEMGFNVLISYGLTEASPCVTMTRLNDGPITATETVGRPLEDVEIKVIDEEGETLPHAEVGELCVRGYNVMTGYWDDPEATAQVLDSDGWLHTGDLASISPNGPVRIHGRKGQDIIRAGYKVYPGAVEIKLQSFPGVKEVAVVGVPDLIFGEMIFACVVPQPGVKLNAEDLIDSAEGTLPDFAIPDRVIFFDELPRKNGGVIDKGYLRDRVRIHGHAWKFGHNIDTNMIIPARRCSTVHLQELGKYFMEDSNPEVVSKIQRGDIIVTGSNFGCGSSSEISALTIKAIGISAVIAESFSRFFFRNAINIGLPIFECSEAVNDISEGDEVKVTPKERIIQNLSKNQSYSAKPFPDFIQNIVNKGGLIAYINDRLIKERNP
jgi:fatty-acyl-CoA synthase